MKQLSGVRGWEYAYRKAIEEHLVGLRTRLEEGEGRKGGEFQYLCGKIRGIREAINLLDQARKDYRLEDDVDLAG